METDVQSLDAPTSGTADQFSIWAILRTTLFVAGWLATFKIWPFITAFLLSAWLAFWSTRLLFRLRGKGVSLLKRGLFCTLMLFFWAVFYVCSVGPVYEIMRWADLPRASQQLVEFGYTPVIWLHDATPLKEPLKIYADRWHEISRR